MDFFDKRTIHRTGIAYLLALCLLTVSVAQGEEAWLAAGGEWIEFPSYTADSYRDIFHGNHRENPDEIRGLLFMPEGAVGKVPAVILQHGSGHPFRSSRERWDLDVVAGLNEHGIAVFIPDGYTSRGIVSSVQQQTELSPASRVIDGAQAFLALAADPRIDATRIGISGYSFGGFVSIELAHAQLAQALLGEQRFAAHAPIYPDCQRRWERVELTGAPMLLMLAELDDYTPAHFCHDYTASMQELGYPVRFIEYEGAHHSFNYDFELAYREHAVFRECPVATVREDGGFSFIERLSDADFPSWGEYIITVFQECGTRGVHLGYHEPARDAALADLVQFYRDTLLSPEP
ncbi:Dienelactone hydrolase [Ectothiorhodosinus mongolicus]|uniref:Dienelactone hydrolase n=1 Tax=Ectothiorhodosinus mongolicus TaxID=233100 RepID=A0A1R3VM44_9GAMM|nr:dienelactone hydrolase family protein [Ectothiorhodosinus mongolicus]ULX57796.1 hypothetical protein CKX93_09120 [Ectothiorhodosinus mongolicus]SIT65660.1 Dienelactone hydrolase [Ectothiorhodosinus mongolicus]